MMNNKNDIVTDKCKTCNRFPTKTKMQIPMIEETRWPTVFPAKWFGIDDNYMVN